MSVSGLRLSPSRQALPGPSSRKQLGRLLVEAGAITPGQLALALQLQLRCKAPLGEILVAEGWTDRETVHRALSDQFGVALADLDEMPPDPQLCARLPTQFWLRHRVVPCGTVGGATLIATGHPDRFEAVRASLAEPFGPVIAVLEDEDRILDAIARQFRDSLAEAASCRTPAHLSCRSWRRLLAWAPALLLTLACLALLAFPAQGFTLMTVTAVGALVLFAGMKLCAITSQLLAARARREAAAVTAPGAPSFGSPSPGARAAWPGSALPQAMLAAAGPPAPPPRPRPMPKVSIIVPLYREPEIVRALTQRLTRLTYPKALLEIVLVLEERDHLTRDALDCARLPAWVRCITVPAHGGLTTKPRAMNYALDFCDGEIIGVWDAEDAPACDQIERVVAHFAEAPEDVVCLQGVLDYYNPRTNWMARCFALEYASWFRIVLPGMARLGLVVPLGGTTLFMRRERLEELGAWDAHNVTEDADLGMRICRRGWRTEMLESVTYEESNCHPWRWMRQRSRWLKGYLMTYLVHMSTPRQLLRELGWRRFVSFQAFFVGTLSQFLLAPVLWTFWLLFAGLRHPVESTLGETAVTGFMAIFLAAEAMSWGVGVAAAIASDRRFLIPSVPLMLVYFPFGVIAAYKALWEVMVAPFYWDKTQHGLAPAEGAEAPDG